MGQFVGDYVNGLGKVREKSLVAITEHHLTSVPERVVVVDTAVHVAIQTHAAAIDRVAIEDLFKEVASRPQSVERPIDGIILGQQTILGPCDGGSGKHRALFAIENGQSAVAA